MSEGPGLALVEFVKTHYGDGFDLNAQFYALAIICKTDKSERALQVARDHAVQFVHIFGTVFVAPFDAQNIDGFHSESFTP
jgi:hypothetical protein